MTVKSIPLAALAFCLLYCSPLKAQFKKADSLKQVIGQMPNDTVKVNAMKQLIIEYIDKRNDEAIALAAKQLALAKKLHYDKGQAIAWRLMGVAYEASGDMQNGIESALKSLKIFEKMGDEAGVAGSYNNIGVVYLDENQTAQALDYFKKALDIYGKMKHHEENVWRGNMNIGRIYEKQKQDTLALKFYMQSLAVSETLKQNQLTFKSNSLYHVSGIYFYRKQYADTRKWLTQAINIVSNADEAEFPHLSEMYLLLSKLNIAQKQYNAALTAAQKGLSIGKKYNYKALLPDNYLQMAKVYAAIGNYSSAYNYQTLYTQLKDSIVNADNVKAVEKLQYNYKLQKKEDVNVALLKDKKLNQVQILLQKTTIQRQYAMGCLIGVALLSAVILMVFYYRNLQIKKKDNELLIASRQEVLQQNLEITEQHEEIISQNEQLEQINATKDKLFSIISHDLRSPVLTLQDTLTLFNSELLTREEITSISAELLANVTGTSALLDNVLYWAKSQMEGISLNKVAFDIQALISSNLHSFSKQAANKHIKLVNQYDQAILVMADISTIDIVLRNLIANAIKFSRAGDSIIISAVVVDQLLHLSVTDTGIGMSDEVQQKLFKPDEYYTSFGTANEKGTGLGLNLCRYFATLNGGSIGVESTVGKGSTFTFTVPIA
ncbi:tetratricopeptide repeat-containing sensor histidine kinase [Mucilaginibacter mali]|uniref:histidine kinase n=1 Tax=Mucilaginibacter mali TaxID=2740462 RepID=A0A7D4PXF3_9SPHI|nr:ATP-binding protein [Mucilaginibacter mali]QKJ32423.1 tetratricopeptide repeat-containing sensor histidine kinase [Mucilaginibacter mali]